MKKYIFLTLIFLSKNCYSSITHNYNDILKEYDYFTTDEPFDLVILYDESEDDPDNERNHYAIYEKNNMTIKGYINDFILNKKVFKIGKLPGLRKYNKDEYEWKFATVFKKNNSICVESVIKKTDEYYEQFGREIIFVENIRSPKPYYLKGKFLDCKSLKKIKNKFYFPIYKIYGAREYKDGKNVTIEYRKISKKFPLKYKFYGVFPDRSNVFEFILKGSYEYK